MMALLRQVTLTGLYLVKLAADTFVLLVLFIHSDMFLQLFDLTLPANDLAAQVIVSTVYGGNFFKKLLHGSDTICVKQIKKRRLFLQPFHSAITGMRFAAAQFNMYAIFLRYKVVPIRRMMQ